MTDYVVQVLDIFHVSFAEPFFYQWNEQIMSSLEFLRKLVSFESTSLLSNIEITNYIENVLKGFGFFTERIEYDDSNGVRKANVVGKLGNGTGGLAYFGHTDVVPVHSWFSDRFGPYKPTVQGDKLYGRGSCDMKGSIACMLAAAQTHSDRMLEKPLYIVCTADEEVGYLGANEVAKRSELFREMVDGKTRGIIGEPTMLEVVHAHKGTYGFRVTSNGKAAHSSTREGLNANLAMIPFLGEMKKIHDETEAEKSWYHDEFDPPTLSWNIGVNDHTKAVNITPAQSICTVYFRPMPGQNPQELLDRASQKATECGLDFEVLSQAEPLYLDPKSMFVREMLELAGKSEPKTVSYGTDGAAFKQLENLVVFGPGDIAQAHTHDEWILLKQLELGTEAYSKAIETWCFS